MSDVVVVANSVVWVSGPKTIVQAGTSLAPGQLVYVDANNRAQLALNDTSAHAAATGLTLGTAVNNQFLAVAQAGAQVTLGGNNVVTKGGCYHVSANAGAIAPEADFSTGQYVTQVGRSPNITDIVLELNQYGYTHG